MNLKKIFFLILIGLILLITGIVFYFVFFDKLVHRFNTLFPTELTVSHEIHDDLSEKNPLPAYKKPAGSTWDFEATSDLSKIYYYASIGALSSSIEQCAGNAYCIGGYAAKNKDQSICESYSFKLKYYTAPMCQTCGMERLDNPNSTYENCYVGFGVINKDQDTCINLPQLIDSKNAPEYPHDRSSVSKIKKESCLYGVAIGKNNPKACETANFFKKTCWDNFQRMTSN